MEQRFLEPAPPLITVSDILEHYSTGLTLDTYTHVTGERQKEPADRMGGFIAQAL